MRRVAVVGCSGAGKSTLARALAESLGAGHVELDAIFHQPGWTPLPREEFRARMAERLGAERWVVDGNYGSSVQGMVLDAADTVVWLDLPRAVVMRQVIARTLGRMARRTELWNGNRERWTNLFDPRPEENIVMWAFTRHPMYRRTYAAMAASEERPHLTWHRLRSRADVATFLEHVPAMSSVRSSTA